MSKYYKIYDPWKQMTGGKKWNAIVESFKKFGWNASFVKRNVRDQFSEGSCGHVSLMRALLIEKFGEEGATMPIPDDYAMATWLLGSYIK